MSSRRSRTLIVALAGLVVVIVAAGVVWWVNDPARGPQVLAVGDSVTFIASDDIKSAFAWTEKVNVQGRPGFRTDELVPVAIQQIEETDPEILVVLTGYNDLLQLRDTDGALDQMMEVAANTPCAVWILLPTKGKYDRAAAQDINDRIVLLAQDHPSVHVEGAWRDAVDATDGPEPSPDLVDDGVHPQVPAGSERLAQIMEDIADRDCR